MFIGHYAAAFAARAARPSIPLWQLFIAVQLVDFAWAGLILIGVEHVRITPGHMAASNLDLYHMPWTHSLVASVVWAIAAGLVYTMIRRGAGAVTAGVIVALAVLSHWLADLIVHGPDLALWPGSVKVGFGLWNSLLWSQVVEIGGLMVGAAIYLANTRPKGVAGRVAPFILVGFMLAVQLYSHLPTPAPPPVAQFAVTALIAYSILALAAWAADRTRSTA